MSGERVSAAARPSRDRNHRSGRDVATRLISGYREWQSPEVISAATPVFGDQPRGPWLAWWPPDPGPEAVMTVARTVADVLAERVVFEVECIDRMFVNLYQPKLQYQPG